MMNIDTPSPEFTGFFKNTRAGKLCFPRCGGCRMFHWYPMPRCPHCRGNNWCWHRISGVGIIHSFTRVEHAFDKERAQDLPYIVALITFEEAPGVRLISNIVDEDTANLRIGQSVYPVFGYPADDQLAVVFRLIKIDTEAHP
jgi:uncharacterized OB-fold protein